MLQSLSSIEKILITSLGCSLLIVIFIMLQDITSPATALFASSLTPLAMTMLMLMALSVIGLALYQTTRKFRKRLRRRRAMNRYNNG